MMTDTYSNSKPGTTVPTGKLVSFEQSANKELIIKVEQEKSSSSMFVPIVTGVLIALVPACIGYGVDFSNDLRKNHLNFTNKQIEKLYGPLYALTQANEATWNQFAKSIMKSEGKQVYFSFDRPVSNEEATAWRLWMKTVFQPINQKIEETIQGNAQLIAGNQMPKVFTEVIAHAEAYKGIIASWKADDEKMSDYGSLSKNTVVNLNYPDAITQCVKDTYLLLKQHQQNLESMYVINPFTSYEVGSASSC